jgi:hypothetical protein
MFYQKCTTLLKKKTYLQNININHKSYVILLYMQLLIGIVVRKYKSYIFLVGAGANSLRGLEKVYVPQETVVLDLT